MFVKCFQDTTQAPGAIMRDDGFSLTLSNIPCDIFPRFREHEQKQMGTTIITLLKGGFTFMYIVPSAYCPMFSRFICQVSGVMDVKAFIISLVTPRPLVSPRCQALVSCLRCPLSVQRSQQTQMLHNILSL